MKKPAIVASILPAWELAKRGLEAEKPATNTEVPEEEFAGAFKIGLSEEEQRHEMEKIAAEHELTT